MEERQGQVPSAGEHVDHLCHGMHARIRSACRDELKGGSGLLGDVDEGCFQAQLDGVCGRLRGQDVRAS